MYQQVHLPLRTHATAHSHAMMMPAAMDGNAAVPRAREARQRPCDLAASSALHRRVSHRCKVSGGDDMNSVAR